MRLLFDAEILPHDTDYFEEISLTEQGAMTEPEFIARFKTVGKRGR